MFAFVCKKKKKRKNYIYQCLYLPGSMFRMSLFQHIFQLEQFVVGVVRILLEPAGSGSTPPGVQALQVLEFSANNAFSQTHYPLQSPPVLR